MTVDAISHFAPEIGLLITACVVLILGLSKAAFVRSLVAPLSLAILLSALVFSARGAEEALGATFAGLRISAMTLYVRHITLAIGALIVLVNWSQPTETERGEFFSMMLFSITGVLLTVSAEDLAVFFLAIELVSVPTYILVATGSNDVRAQEAGMKYFFLGAMSAGLMVYGFSFLYGVSGTTTMTVVGDTGAPSLAAYLQDSFHQQGELNVYATIGLLLAFAGLAFKIGAVPFHFYVPDVYQGAPSPITGMLGFVPKLAGLVGLTKMLALTGWLWSDNLFWMLWVVAAATMTVGNVLALMQNNVKRMLAYSSIAHSGYMLIGILVGPVMGEGPMRDGVAAMLFYIAVYGIMNLGAFAVLASLKVGDKPVEEVSDLAGLSRREPLVALAMVVCCFSLMGLPPVAGFLGKVYLFTSAFSLPASHIHHQAMIVLAVVGVLNSAIGAAYYLRIIATCYLHEPERQVDRVPCGALRLGVTLCAITMPALFVWPTNIANQAQHATRGLVIETNDTGRQQAARVGAADRVGSFVGADRVDLPPAGKLQAGTLPGDAAVVQIGSGVSNR